MDLSAKIPQWQIDKDLIRPKGPTPELDASRRATRVNKRSNKTEEIRQALKDTARDPATFTRVERKVAIDYYGHIFEEVGQRRYAQIKRREAPLPENPSTEVGLSEFQISNLIGVCILTTS